MIRRQLIIEWDDDGTDTDEDCAATFKAGDWTVQDLIECDLNVVITVKDAPTT